MCMCSLRIVRDVSVHSCAHSHGRDDIRTKEEATEDWRVSDPTMMAVSAHLHVDASC